MLKTITLYITFIYFILFYSCDGDNPANSEPVIPDSNVSYAQHIQPMFNLHCVNCHGVGVVEAGLDLTTHAGTTADPRIVFKGEPDNSVLIWTIEQRAGFPPMPPLASSYKPFNENQVKGLKTWIREGAQNN